MANLSVGGGFTYLRQLLRLAEKFSPFTEIVVFGRPGLADVFDAVQNVRFVEEPSLAGNRWRDGGLLGYPDYVRHIASVSVWRARSLPRALLQAGVDLLFAPGCLLPAKLPKTIKAVVMCQNMLPFDHGERSRFGWGLTRLKFTALERAQVRSFRAADGLLFISEHARRVVEGIHGPFGAQIAVIPHGVGDSFRMSPRDRTDVGAPLRLAYVSPIAEWKHQWMVVEALRMLRERHHPPMTLDLIGWVQARPGRRLKSAIARASLAESVRIVGPVSHEEVARQLGTTDIFVFASSCENCPNTLLEAMAAGLPIACSDRAPMPEFARDSVVYFDPENPRSIADGIEKLLKDPALRTRLGRRAVELSEDYTWQTTAQRTFAFLESVCRVS